MVTRIASVYRVDIHKNDHRQTKDGDKKKSPIRFGDVLAKALMEKKA